MDEHFDGFATVPAALVVISHRQTERLKVVLIRVLLAVVAAALGVLGAGVSRAPVAQAAPPYAICKAAAADGRYNIPRGDPAYGAWVDRDNDGIACESH